MFRFSIFMSTLLFSAFTLADGLDPVGQVAYCQKEQQDAFAYQYDLENVALIDNNLEVDIFVRNFVCSKAKENGDTVYFWKLVKDKTWTVQVTVGSFFQKEIRYEETDTTAVYQAHVSIPVKYFLSIIDEQTLRNNGAVDIQRAAFFKHHNNSGWVALGSYRLVLNLHLRKHSDSFIDGVQFFHAVP